MVSLEIVEGKNINILDSHPHLYLRCVSKEDFRIIPTLWIVYRLNVEKSTSGSYTVWEYAELDSVQWKLEVNSSTIFSTCT